MNVIIDIDWGTLTRIAGVVVPGGGEPRSDGAVWLRPYDGVDEDYVALAMATVGDGDGDGRPVPVATRDFHEWVLPMAVLVRDWDGHLVEHRGLADIAGLMGCDSGPATDGAAAEPHDEEKPERPAHYRRGGVECRDVEEALLSDSEVDALTAHLWMDALEYLWRWDLKGGVEDLRKARRCVEEMARRAEGAERGEG